MKKINAFLVILSLCFALTVTGCGGSGGGTATSQFMGGRIVGFNDEDWNVDGGFEVDIQANGTYGPNGAAYLNVYDPETEEYFNYEGDVKAGRIANDGSFTFEALINKTGWPLEELDSPFYLIAVGQLVLRGGHYEGAVHVDYYEWSEGSGRSADPYKSEDYNLWSQPVTRAPGEVRQMLKGMLPSH